MTYIDAYKPTLSPIARPWQCLMLLIYMNSTAQINEWELLFFIIRNEKVGCSIHLSGTNEIKESPLLKP